MKKGKEPKKPSYFWEVLGVVVGLIYFAVSICADAKQNATGRITYNDEGLVSFESYGLEAFYGLLLAAGCIASIVYKKSNS